MYYLAYRNIQQFVWKTGKECEINCIWFLLCLEVEWCPIERRLAILHIKYKFGRFATGFGNLQKNTITIWIPNIWNTNIWPLQHFFVPFSNGLITWLDGPFKHGTFNTINHTFLSGFQTTHHSNSGLFDKRTLLDFLNTRLVQYSGGYCIIKQ